MWRAKQRRQAEAFSAYWTARVRGTREEDLRRLSVPLDPGMVETVNQIAAGHRPVLPDPQFVARLERDLRRDFSPAFQETAAMTLAATSTNGTTPLRPWTPPARQRPSLWQRAIPLAATLLLLLVTAWAGYVAFIHQKLDLPEAPVVIPAATTATPVISDAPAALLWRIEQPWGIPSVEPRTGNVWIPNDAGSFAVFSPEGELLETWGTPGDGPGEFDLSVFGGAANYGGSVFDPAGNLYVVDSGNERIEKFGPDRAFITTWGETGVDDGQFLFPREIAIDGQGRLFVTDEGRHDVQVFTSDGQFLFSFGEQGKDAGQFFEPAGVAIDRDGNIWIGDFGNRRLQKFTPNGTFLGEFGNSGPVDERLGNMFGIAASADGYIFAPNSRDGRVQVFDTVGNQVAMWGQPGNGDEDFYGPSEVALDGQGNLYVSDDGSLRKFRILLPPLPPTSELVPPATPRADITPEEET